MTSGPGRPMSEVPDHFGAPSTILSCPGSGSAPEQPLGRPLPPQLYDLFPWAFHRLPGPHQEMFRYQKAVRGYICREISRHKLRTPEDPKEFISCYLAQITKVGLKQLQTEGGRDGGGCLPGCISFQGHGLSSSSWPQFFRAR